LVIERGSEEVFGVDICRRLQSQVAVRLVMEGRTFLRGCLLLFCFFFLSHSGLLADPECLDIGDVPLETKIRSAPPNIMFVLDNSGSMDATLMTTEEDGLVVIGGETYHYVFDDPGDNLHLDVMPRGAPRLTWKTQWSGYNRIYYNPDMEYQPWPGMTPADPSRPKSNPVQNTPTFDLAAEYCSVDGAGAVPISIRNAHYYTWNDINEDGIIDTGESVYLVNFVGRTRAYYRLDDGDADGVVEPGELFISADAPAGVKSKVYDGAGNFIRYRTDTEDLQNFANWYSYYRRRELTAKAAVARIIKGLKGVQVGFYSINSGLRQPVLPVGGSKDETETLLEALYSLDSSGGKPLRRALLAVGQYYHQDDRRSGDLGDSPYADEANGGACQQSFSVIITDGYYDGPSPAVGNQDGDQGDPYADFYQNTLADVAMKYYKEDLSAELPNSVPANACDRATHQHMVTYGVSFGVTGTLTFTDTNGDGEEDDACFLNSRTPIPIWPNPASGNPEKIDDLWHAAVNGRGRFFSALTPKGLVDSLEVLFQNIVTLKSSGASVLANSEQFDATTVLYQASYDSTDWTGDMTAYPADPATGEILTGNDDVLWRASDVLRGVGWDERHIVTYDGTSTGIRFQYDNLTSDQRTDLDSNWETDPTLARNLVEYLRGREIDGFRPRAGSLGDIVHSSPFLINDTLFVGANDGMLHAFNAATGEERFAYVPDLVFENLMYLKDNNYTHKFYVDLSPVAVEHVGGMDMTLLVGGLGKGGKGYYVLDVSDADSVNDFASENSVADMVLWEYPRRGASDDDMGYTFSQAFIVRSYAAAYEWVIIFGNGYDSANAKAVLFVLDLDGNVIRKIDTGEGACNGLSTPSLVDVDGDRKVDYAYAGDLRGNLWKFDLTDSDPANWGIPFDDGTDPEPLFQAKDQPITTKPDVMRHPTEAGYIVVFGTGKYLETDDPSNTEVESIFGVWDYGDDDDEEAYLGSFNRADGTLSNQPNDITLLEQTEIDFRTASDYDLRTLSDNPIHWATEHIGWYFDLPLTGERVIESPFIRDGKVVVVSFTPDTSPCSNGGVSIVHEIDAATGERLDEAQFDINEDRIVDTRDFITLDDRLLAPTGRTYRGALKSPTILRMPDQETEMKAFSSSEGGVEVLFERAEKRGLFFWVEK
jgi:type IV pilus assembly protein PilY1